MEHLVDVFNLARDKILKCNNGESEKSCSSPVCSPCEKRLGNWSSSPVGEGVATKRCSGMGAKVRFKGELRQATGCVNLNPVVFGTLSPLLQGTASSDAMVADGVPPRCFQRGLDCPYCPPEEPAAEPES